MNMNAIMACRKIVYKNKNRFFLNQHPEGVQKNCTPSGFEAKKIKIYKKKNIIIKQ